GRAAGCSLARPCSRPPGRRSASPARPGSGSADSCPTDDVAPARSRWLSFRGLSARRPGMPVSKLLPGPAAAHARGLLGHDVRARPRVLVADLDQDPAALAGAGQAEPAGDLVTVQGEVEVARLDA